MNNSINDAGIPVLTEVISSSAKDSSLEGNHVAPSASATQVDHAIPKTPVSRTWDEDKWKQVERAVRKRILLQMLERIDFVLEQRIRDSLADVMQTAVDGLAADIKSGLHRTIKDVVTRAVAQEISRLQSLKK
jgi:hypothetical protein